MLTLAGVAHSYVARSRSRRVLDAIDLAVAPGEAVAIIGEAGAGKSVLWRLALGLERPRAGSVRLGNLDLTAMDDRQAAAARHRDIGAIPTNAVLLPHLSLRDNVLLPATLDQVDADARARTQALLMAVSLDARADLQPSAATDDERHRAALARAFLQSPGIVVADDPARHLAPPLARTYVELLMRLHARHHSALVLLTRSADHTAACDRRLRLTGGRLAAA